MAFKDRELLVLSCADNSTVNLGKIQYGEFVATLAKDMGNLSKDMMHMAVGISGEAGELLDGVKKIWVYNKVADRVNLIEELGDLEFYMQGMRLLLGVSRQEVLEANYVKLQQRYQGEYSDEKAQERADKKEEEKLQVIDMSASPITSTGSDDLERVRRGE